MRNARLTTLPEFAFARLARLLAGITPATAGPDLSIGDPKGEPPAWLADRIVEAAAGFNSYPPPAGTPELRAAIARWLERRFAVTLDAEREILPVAGTKEALHLLASVVVGPTADGPPPAVLMPNPLYQVYLGAAVMAGAEPVPLAADASTGFLPDLEAIPEATLARTQLFYLCAPSNPQGRAAGAAYWRRALELARAYDFVLVADECYSEIYHGEAPTGALEAAVATTARLDHLVVFNSLSKRSNAAGLRVGFMAGDARVLARTLKVRRYGGATIPRPLQHAAVGLFDDEEHVAAIRRGYTTRVDAALERLDGRFGAFRPDGGFFLWLDVGDGERAARTLYARAGVKALPGRYLALADAGGRTPADRYLRLALVHDLETTLAAVDGLVTQLEPAA
ncbi:MAG: aminotransferase class I/II-fold pyridoxal phosphate-dependent enzyme [Alphaproteobacteria bacterium]